MSPGGADPVRRWATLAELLVARGRERVRNHFYAQSVLGPEGAAPSHLAVAFLLVHEVQL